MSPAQSELQGRQNLCAPDLSQWQRARRFVLRSASMPFLLMPLDRFTNAVSASQCSRSCTHKCRGGCREKQLRLLCKRHPLVQLGPGTAVQHDGNNFRYLLIIRTQASGLCPAGLIAYNNSIQYLIYILAQKDALYNNTTPAPAVMAIWLHITALGILCSLKVLLIHKP